ncbi:matrilin [Plakobranchus ocellatus]|uniref:Matrilin n=1 Tax=Plakobranchus ocellatus TaxID=259542 RepID=A0AAV4D861_9GAST|nr:matrilin [Plakobranchus ocellatus]
MGILQVIVMTLFLWNVNVSIAAPRDTGAYDIKEKCSQKPMELALILDISSSVDWTGFKDSEAFLENLIKKVEIGPEKTRVSLVSFAGYIYKEYTFPLGTYTTTDALLNAIKRIEYPAGNATNIHLAIDYMRTVQLNETKVRPYVRKVCLLITDGEATNPKLAIAAGQKAQSDGILMFGVLISKYRRYDNYFYALQEMCGAYERMILLRMFTGQTYYQENVKKMLLKTSCNQRSRSLQTIEI